MDTQSVHVEITKETSAPTKPGFGKPLLLSTSAKQEYKEYDSLSDLSKDFNEKKDEYKLANAVFSQSPSVPTIAVYGINYSASGSDSGGGKAAGAEALSSALNDLVTKHNDWYFLMSTEQGDKEIKELASWIDTQDKLYFASTDNKQLSKDIKSKNAIIMYHSKPKSYPAEAWVGACAPKDPGSITWKFKKMNGIEPVSLNASTLKEIHKNNGNTYVNVMGHDQTSEGQSTSGEYIDILRGIDWIKSRMQEKVQSILVSNDKIAFDGDGLSKIEAGVRSVLREGVNNSLIATDDDGNGEFTLDMPDRDDIPKEKIQDRILPDVKWTATLSGAVHEVEIIGTMKY